MVSPFFGAPLWLWGAAVLLDELLPELLLFVEPHADNTSTLASAHAAAMYLDNFFLLLRCGGGNWGPPAAQRFARPRGDARPEDREQEQSAGDDRQRVRGHVVERQRDAARAQQEDRDDHAEQVAATAEDRDAAEQDAGDDRQLEPGAVVAARATAAHRVDDPGQGGDRARDDEQPELDALDAQPGEARRLVVGADREDRAADGGPVQRHAEDHGQDCEQDRRVGDLGAGERPLAEVQIGGRE